MGIGQIMSQSLVCLDMDNTLANAKEIFDSNAIHHILINDGKKLCGVITDRDLHIHLSPSMGTKNETHQDSILMNKKLHLIMRKELITASSDLSINEAVLLFNDNKISCLPVINDQGIAIGIITWRDIIKVIAIQYRRKVVTEKTVDKQ